MYCLFVRGASAGCNTTEISNRLVVLKDELNDLDRQERELDKHKMWVQQSIKNVTDEVTNTRYPFQETDGRHVERCREGEREERASERKKGGEGRKVKLVRERGK